MSAPSLWTSDDAYYKAELLLQKSNGIHAREAVEILLVNQQDTQDDNNQNRKGKNAGNLLQKGLSLLVKAPHETLGVPIGARTQVIFIVLILLLITFNFFSY